MKNLLLLLAVIYLIRENDRNKAFPDTAPFQTVMMAKEVKNLSTPDTSQEWTSSIQKDLAQREYHISYDKQKQAYQSPNRTQNIRSYYEPGKWKLQNRIDSAGNNWQVQLSTVGLYADDQLLARPQKEASVRYHENIIEFRHAFFTEQYLNTEEGVRQNFIVDSAPKGTSTLRVDLELEGFSARTISSDKLQWSNGQTILSYSDLQVWDAHNTVLPAHIESEDQYIRLIVDATDAVYPITIDPIVSNGHPGNANTLLENNQADAFMGYSVSGAGDVNGDGYSDIIVGAHMFDNGELEEGAAFIYHGSASGIRTTPAVILECNQAIALFGVSVSNAGDVNGDGYSDVIVGASQYTNGQPYEGAAFVYHGSANGIISTPAVILESDQEGAKLGISVSGAGDVNGDGYSDVIAGAYGYSNGEEKEGVAFIYHGSATGISGIPAVLLESNQEKSNFGYWVAGTGDINNDGYSDVIIGANFYDHGETDEGAAFIYHGSANGISNTPAVMLESNQENAWFGTNVSGAGDVNGDGYADVIVGAARYNLTGAAFVYHGSSTGISSTATVRLESDQLFSFFGMRVSSAGDVNGDGYSDIIVGAYMYDNGEAYEGMAFVYHGSASGIVILPAARLESNQEGAQFGVAVSSAGDVNGDGYSDIIVGAYTYNNGEKNEGAAFVYHGSADGPSNTSAVMLESNQEGAQFGVAVSSAGDVNGDGYSDVIVGASQYDQGEENEGVAFVYYGSASGISSTPAVMLENNQTYALFGYSVSGAGDVNGDGYSDIIVGAYMYDHGELNEGAAFVYHGSASGISSTPAVMLESNQADARFGYSVSGTGDVNGDGYSDIIVGAYMYDHGENDEGVAFVYHGSASGISNTPAMMLESNQADASMGYSVSGAGDINGDGYSDVVVGACMYDNGELNEGTAFVYHGSASGISNTPAVMLESNQTYALFGASLSGIGDVNGDGYSDIIVGAYGYDNGEPNEGAAFVYHGSASGISSTPAVMLESNQASAQFGSSVSGAGDVNGDGYSDVIVGSYMYDNGGVAFVYHGSATGISNTPSTMLESNQASAQFGFSVSGAGDVNGDGYSDIIVGAILYDHGETNEGTVFVYQGNNGGGLRKSIQLLNETFPATVLITQPNVYASQFGVQLFFHNMQGLSGARLVWEVRAEGEAFSSADGSLAHSTNYSERSAAFSSTNIADGSLKEIITKAGFETKVRVRIQYDPVTSLNGQVYSPWIYLQGYFGTHGMSSTPLPITLLSFAAKPIGEEEVIVTWTTGSEIKNEYFTIERSSDGEYWEEVTKVAATGNATNVAQYTYSDVEPYTGVSYYRLKQTDIDGSYAYSEMVMVRLQPESKLLLYPNPTNESLTIESTTDPGAWYIYNNLGQLLNDHVQVLSQTGNKVVLDVNLLPPGLYLLESQEGQGRFYKK